MRVVIVLFAFLLTFLPCWGGENIKLPSAVSKFESLLFSKNYPKLYKPTKLEIGQKAVFKITAEPKSRVILGLSYENQGAKDFYGTTPRLGANYNVIEAVVPENGILNMEYNMEKNRDLTGKIMFIEAFVCENNKNNFKLAKIIGANGQEIEFNGIEIKKPSSYHGASILPDIPGVTADSVDAVKDITSQKAQYKDTLQYDKYYNADYTDYTPVYIRNMKSPDVKEKINEPKN